MSLKIKGIQVESVGVLGAGAPGAELAFFFATELAPHGVEIRVADSDPGVLEGARKTLEENTAKLTESGALKKEKADRLLSAVRFVEGARGLRDCTMVVEAVSDDDLDGKRSALASLSESGKGDLIVLSNSPYFGPSESFTGWKDATRVLGVHHLPPLQRNMVVEVIPHERTRPETVRFVLALYEQIGKAPLLVAERYGHALNPILAGLFMAAARIAEEGLAGTKQIDAVARKCLGLAAGPFAAMNLSGGRPLSAESIRRMQQERILPTYPVPANLQRFLNSGQAWEAAGKDEAVDVPDSVRARIAPLLRGAFFGLAGSVLDSGIVSLADLELGVSLGLNMQGPCQLMNEIGVRDSLEIVKAYAKATSALSVPSCLEHRAASGEPWRIPCTVREDFEGIAVVKIRRPKVLNALSPELMDELRELFGRLKSDPNVKGVVLTGFGTRAFVAGADINHLAHLKNAKEAEAFSLEGQAVFNTIENLGKPVVCALNGLAFGGGSEIAMACHARLAGKNVKVLAAQPEPKLGVIPGYGGTQRFPRWVGMKNAWPILRTGNPISSGTAAEIGYILKEVEGDVVEAALGLLKDVLGGTTALGTIPTGPIEVPADLPEVDIGHLSRKIDRIQCDAILKGAATTLEEGLQIEARAFGACFETRDGRIGLENFLKFGPKKNAEFVNE
jgi:enoyl-CoA hydratase/3-hydroxyacyl-CoA dehydrogenase